MSDHDLRAEIARLRREKSRLLVTLNVVVDEIGRERDPTPVIDYARRVIAKHEEKTR